MHKVSGSTFRDRGFLGDLYRQALMRVHKTMHEADSRDLFSGTHAESEHDFWWGVCRAIDREALNALQAEIDERNRYYRAQFLEGHETFSDYDNALAEKLSIAT